MSDYRYLLEQLRLEKRELTWRAADAIEALVRERDEIIALAKDTEDARVEVAIRLMEVAREKHETEVRAERAEAALRELVAKYECIVERGDDEPRSMSDIDLVRARAVLAQIEGAKKE